MTRRNLFRTGAALAAAILLIVLFGARVARVSALYPDALPENPYFVPGHLFLLYVATPLLLLAALVVFIAPGLLLVRTFGRTRQVAPLFLKGTLVAFLVNIAVLGALKLIRPAPGAGVHAAALFGLNIVAWALLAVRSLRGAAGDEREAAGATRRWAWLIAIPVIAAILLLPVLFWQDLNPDGLEALTGGRSLAWFALPRFPDGETPGLNLGMITSSYPIHWFIALFGLTDAAGRLPVLLYAPMIWAGLVALIEVRAPRRLSAGEELALVAALAVFVAALGFNDTYHAYSTDIASPANIDFLAMAGVLATLYFFWNDEPGWFLSAALLTHLTRPTGLMLLGLLGVGVFLLDRERLRPRLLLIGTAIALMMVWTVGFEKLLPRLIDISIDSGAGQVAGRFRYLRFDHFQRLLWVVIPAGILPALALPQLRRQDNVARVLSLMTVAYFGVFYVIAFTALHHFAPATLFLIVVFWRLALKSPATARRTAVTVAAAALALWLSLPRSMALDRTMRPIGAETVWNEGDYGGGYDEYRRAYDHKALLLELFKPFWEVADPGAEFIGSPWLQIRYGRHGAIRPETNYVVQPLGDPAPAGFTRLAADSAAALWVRDLDRWRADRFQRRDTEWQSPALRV
ncbi:MAG: hypothetical protein PVH00_11505, partial [Gemmatimonadota bacterium]